MACFSWPFASPSRTVFTPTLNTPGKRIYAFPDKVKSADVGEANLSFQFAQIEKKGILVPRKKSIKNVFYHQNLNFKRFMKKISFKTGLLLSVLCSVIVLSCKKSEIVTNPTVTDPNSPASQIAASENLVIPASVDLPTNAPNGNTRVATFYAVGVQKYKAQEIAGSSPVAYQWVFVAPQADLYDATNKKVGNHSAGPTWQLSAADSMYGQAFTPARTAPGVDANSIDWLLLMPKQGKASTGIFADVSYVQRVATKGGKAPTTAPTAATDVVEVGYTAVYRFSKQKQ